MDTSSDECMALNKCQILIKVLLACLSIGCVSTRELGAKFGFPVERNCSALMQGLSRLWGVGFFKHTTNSRFSLKCTFLFLVL